MWMLRRSECDPLAYVGGLGPGLVLGSRWVFGLVLGCANVRFSDGSNNININIIIRAVAPYSYILDKDQSDFGNFNLILLQQGQMGIWQQRLTVGSKTDYDRGSVALKSSGNNNGSGWCIFNPWTSWQWIIMDQRKIKTLEMMVC